MITRRYEITLDRLPAQFSGCRIAFLTDLHGCRRRNLYERIQAEHPDYLLIGGDMILGHRELTSSVQAGIAEAEELMKRLAQSFPVYYAYGNHEGKLDPGDLAAYRCRLEEAGVHFLVNDSVCLERGGDQLILHGLCLEREWFPKGRRRDCPVDEINKKLGTPSEEKCHILLAHHPYYFPAYETWGADLVLAGHLHGGVARLPLIGGVIGPDFLPFPPYSGGVYERGKSKMIVSCGLGAHTIKLRFFNPPELTSIILHGGGISDGKYPGEAGSV